MMYLPSIFGDDLFDSWMGFDDDFFKGFRPASRTESKAASAEGNSVMPTHAASFMKTDITETDNGFTLDIELPGYSKDDIRLELEKGYLSISASHNENKEEKTEGGKVIRRERYYGNMARRFFVGEELTEEEIKARFENGILKLDIPKKKAVVPEKKYIAIEG